MRQNVFVLGVTGNVGGELIRQIGEKDHPDIKNKHFHPTVVAGIASSDHVVVNEGGFPRDVLMDLGNRRKKIGDIAGTHIEHEDVWRMAHQIMDEMGFHQEVVYVDVTSAMEAARDFHLRVIEGGGKVVTANKNPLARFDVDTYAKLTNDPKRYGYRATTMAGLGAVPWISEADAIDDKTKKITASLSGTVGYITDQLSQGIKLSDAIRAAKKAGYTEPDFRDDLNGIDVARKLIILAREAGFPVSIENVTVEKFLPESYFDKKKSADDCLGEIEATLDEEMTKKYEMAKARGKTYKYLASLIVEDDGKITLEIGLKEVPIASAFGSLTSTKNRIEVVTSDLYPPENPWELQGPGAGLKVTAGVVRKDLFRMQSKTSRIKLS